MRCGYRVAAAVGAVVNVGAGATVGGVAFGIGVNTGGLVPGETGVAGLPLLPGALAVGAAGTRGTAATPDDELEPQATSNAAAIKNAAPLARKNLMQAAWPRSSLS